MSTIKNIFWDFGAVLFSEAQISNKEFKPVLDLLGMTVAESDEIFDSLWVDFVRPGKISEDNYWQAYIRASKNKPRLDQVKKLYRDSIWVNQELFSLAKRLSKAYNQYILTNHGKEWTGYLVDRYELMKYFKDIFSSGLMGLAKPSSEFFEYAIVVSKVNPKETFYIDDSEKNIMQAVKLGIKGYVYKDNKSLKKELEKYKII